jgi:hypothetical protein
MRLQAFGPSAPGVSLAVVHVTRTCATADLVLYTNAASQHGSFVMMELHQFDGRISARRPPAALERAPFLHSTHPCVRVDTRRSRRSLPESSSLMIAVRKAGAGQRQSSSRRLSLRASSDQVVALGLFDLWLPPGDRIELHGQLGCELLTYVVTGTLAHALGSYTRALIGPGELQCAAICLDANATHTQTNPSLSDASHVVQLLVHDPRHTLERHQEQRRLSFAQRRGLLCVVAAPIAALGVLAVQSEITLYSSVLEPGQHLVHGFAAAHSGILHVVSGELSVAGYVLGPGDTVHAQGERSLSFTAREQAEVLLGDVNGQTSF